MTKAIARGNVALSSRRSASVVFHQALKAAVDDAPESFAALTFPDDADHFRKRYGELLPEFEAARLAGNDRGPVARQAVDALTEQIVWRDDASLERPLADLLADPGDPLPLQIHQFSGSPGWAPSLAYRGQRWSGDDLERLGRELNDGGMITGPARDALTWMGKHGLDNGRLDLTGRKIAMLGAGAEMAPTRFWLEAGAEVLWLDMVPPPEEWRQVSQLSGRLCWPEHGIDLLARPHEALATLIAFAGGGPIDLGLYAYAPGQARELLLTAAMNGIVNAMPAALLNSVALLVSPTTPTALTAEDRDFMAARLANRPAWESLLAVLGLLGGEGAAYAGDAAASRSVVAIQGGSYQAAQYLGKMLMAECWATPEPDDRAGSFRVSANTAAITRTRSLDHPVFAAAFGGAAAFQAETFSPRLSRRLNGLLTAHDWLHPDPPVPGKVRVHGGIHTLPFPIDPALRVAAVIGFARSPKLIGGLIRGLIRGR